MVSDLDGGPILSRCTCGAEGSWTQEGRKCVCNTKAYGSGASRTCTSCPPFTNHSGQDFIGDGGMRDRCGRCKDDNADFKSDGISCGCQRGYYVSNAEGQCAKCLTYSDALRNGAFTATHKGQICSAVTLKKPLVGVLAMMVLAGVAASL